MNKLELFRTGLAAMFILMGFFIWWQGARESVVLNKELALQHEYVRQVIETRAPNYKHEKELAQAYWKRYPDVAKDTLWGEKGTMGIRGPRDHYINYGRKEGRIWRILPNPADLEQEAKLAEVYWVRYPDVAASSVWGKDGLLGVLGPRDHFELFGSKEERVWGMGNSLHE